MLRFEVCAGKADNEAVDSCQCRRALQHINVGLCGFHADCCSLNKISTTFKALSGSLLTNLFSGEGVSRELFRLQITVRRNRRPRKSKSCKPVSMRILGCSHGVIAMNTDGMTNSPNRTRIITDEDDAAARRSLNCRWKSECRHLTVGLTDRSVV